jgi:hypothetical protein
VQRLSGVMHKDVFERWFSERDSVNFTRKCLNESWDKFMGARLLQPKTVFDNIYGCVETGFNTGC